MSPNSWQDVTNGSKNVVTNRPNFASGKGGHDVTKHFGEGGRYVTSDKLSTLKPGWRKNTWTDRVTVVKCHSRRFVGWTLSLGQNVAWSVCGWTDHQGTQLSAFLYSVCCLFTPMFTCHLTLSTLLYSVCLRPQLSVLLY